jgi:hypothetical protein
MKLLNMLSLLVVEAPAAVEEVAVVLVGIEWDLYRYPDLLQLQLLWDLEVFLHLVQE